MARRLRTLPELPIPTWNAWTSCISKAASPPAGSPKVTGLTTGAITGVVDRLEKAGLVRRERDDADRRKVFIAVVSEAIERLGQFYVPMQQAMEKVFGGYSDAELRLLLRFANEGYKGVLAATAALKGLLDTPPEKRPDLKLKKLRRQP
ncbi:hypothetical protein ACVW0I_004712 [Bradyrhizobium sp. LM6.11]